MLNLQKIRTLDLESFGDDLNAKYNYIKDFMDPPTSDTITQIIDELTTTLGLIECGDIPPDQRDRYLNVHLPLVIRPALAHQYTSLNYHQVYRKLNAFLCHWLSCRVNHLAEHCPGDGVMLRRIFSPKKKYYDLVSYSIYIDTIIWELKDDISKNEFASSKNGPENEAWKWDGIPKHTTLSVPFYVNLYYFARIGGFEACKAAIESGIKTKDVPFFAAMLRAVSNMVPYMHFEQWKFSVLPIAQSAVSILSKLTAESDCSSLSQAATTKLMHNLRSLSYPSYTQPACLDLDRQITRLRLALSTKLLDSKAGIADAANLVSELSKAADDPEGVKMVVDWFRSEKVFARLLDPGQRESLRKCADSDFLGCLYRWDALGAAEVLAMWDTVTGSEKDPDLQRVLCALMTKLVGHLRKEDTEKLFEKITTLSLGSVTEPVVGLVGALCENELSDNNKSSGHTLPKVMQYAFSLCHDRAVCSGLDPRVQQVAIERFLAILDMSAKVRPAALAEYIPVCEKMLGEDDSSMQVSQIWLRLVQTEKDPRRSGEIVQKVVMNLLRFKLGAIQRLPPRLESDPYDTLVTSPATKLTYYKELEQRFRILQSLIAVSSPRPEIFTILCRAFIFNNVSPRERDLFLAFMQNVTAPESKSGRRLLDLGAFDALMYEVLLKMDPDGYSAPAFGCFRNLFMTINGRYRHLDYYEDGGAKDAGGVKEVLSVQLIGLSFIWELVFSRGEVKRQAEELLFEVYRKMSMRLVEKEGRRIRDSFVSECVKRIRPGSAARALDILVRYIEIFDCDDRTHGAPKPAKPKDEFDSTVSVMATFLNGASIQRITVWTDTSTTLEDVLGSIVQKGGLMREVSDLQFLCNGEVLRPNSTRLGQLGFGREIDVLVEPLVRDPRTGVLGTDSESIASLKEMFQGKREQVYALALLQGRGDVSQAATLLSDDAVLAEIERKADRIESSRLAQAYDEGTDRLSVSVANNAECFGSIYACLVSPEAGVADKAWGLISRLPIPEKMLGKLKETSWESVFPTSSHYMLAYSLRTLREFLERSFPAQDHYPFSRQTNTIQALQWLDSFVRKGGYGHLWKLVGDLPATGDGISLECASELVQLSKEIGINLLHDLSGYGSALRRYIQVVDTKEDKEEAKETKRLRIFIEAAGTGLGASLLDIVKKKDVVTMLLQKIREFGEEPLVAKMGTRFIEPAFIFLGAILAVDQEQYRTLYEDNEFAEFILSRVLLQSPNAGLRQLTAKTVRAIVAGYGRDNFAEQKDPVSPPGSYFLSMMVSFLPNPDEACPYCRQYFSLLLNLLSDRTGQDEGMMYSPQDIAKQLTERIFGRLAKKDTAEEDEFIAGCMECLTRLMLKIPAVLPVLTEEETAHGKPLVEALCDALYCPQRGPAELVGLAPKKHTFRPGVKGVIALILALVDISPENKTHVVGRMAEFHSEQFGIPSKDSVYELVLGSGTGKVEQSRYVGLKNFGSTCYINALLQQFFMMPEFRATILGLPADSLPLIDCDRVLFNLQKIFSYMLLADRQYFAPTEFCKDLTWTDHKPVNTAEQHDADEFFNIITDKLEKELKIAGREKVLRDMLGVTLLHEIESLEDRMDYVSTKEESCLTLTLEIKNKAKLEDAFDELVKGDIMDGDDKYFCAKYNTKIRARKRCVINGVSRTFIVHLKRFEFDKTTGIRKKLNDYCSFPLHLSLAKWASKDAAKNAALDYDLVGVLIHSGSAEAGHYVSVIKERAADAGGWFEFNDQRVSPFDFAELQRRCFGRPAGSPSDEWEMQGNAYLLVYQQQQRDVGAHVEQQTKYCDPTYAGFVRDFGRLVAGGEKRILSPGVAATGEEYEGKLQEVCAKFPPVGLRRLVTEYAFDYLAKAKEGKRFSELAQLTTPMGKLGSEAGFNVWFLRFMAAHKAAMFEGLIASRIDDIHTDVYKLLNAAITNLIADPACKESPSASSAVSAVVALLATEGFAHARANSNKFNHFFGLLQRIATSGNNPLRQLLSLRLVGRLIDFVANTSYSLLDKSAKERPKMSETYTSFQAPLALLSTIVRLVPTKEMVATKSAPDPAVLSSPIVLPEEELALLFSAEWDCMTLMGHDQKSLGEILQWLEWESAERTKSVASVVLRNIGRRNSSWDYGKPFEMLKLVLGVKDGRVKQRVQIVFDETPVFFHKNLVEYIGYMREVSELLTFDVLNLLAEFCARDPEIYALTKERMLPAFKWLPKYMETGTGAETIRYGIYSTSAELKAKRETIMGQFAAPIRQFLEGGKPAKKVAAVPPPEEKKHDDNGITAGKRVKGENAAGIVNEGSKEEETPGRIKSVTAAPAQDPTVKIERQNALGDTVHSEEYKLTQEARYSETRDQLDDLNPVDDVGGKSREWEARELEESDALMQGEKGCGTVDKSVAGVSAGKIDYDETESDYGVENEKDAEMEKKSAQEAAATNKVEEEKKITVLTVNTEMRQKVWAEGNKSRKHRQIQTIGQELAPAQKSKKESSAQEQAMMGEADMSRPESKAMNNN